MKRNIYIVFGMAILMWSLFALGSTKETLAEVHMNVNIGPPPIVDTAPPEVVMVPGTQVYFVPQAGIDVFFYNGFWWCPRGDRWYRASAYNGPWTVIKRRYVPGPIIGVPRDYRERFARERRIPYGQWKKEGRHGHRDEHRDRREEREDHEHER